MAEPTLAMSYADLALRVAEFTASAYHGSANSQNFAATIPVDVFTLDRIKRVIEDAIRRFMGDVPPYGYWHWQQRIMSILLYPDGDGPDNISSDAGRYQLAEDFVGRVSGEISYAKDTQDGVRIRWTDEADLRRLRSYAQVATDPFVAAVRPYDTRRYELLLYPDPINAYTIEFPYELNFSTIDLESGIATGGTSTTLVDTTNRTEADDTFNTWTLTVLRGTGIGETAAVTDFDQGTNTITFSAGLSGGSTPDTTTVYMLEGPNAKHPAGQLFDSVIRVACLMEAEQQIGSRGDSPGVPYAEQYFQQSLPQAWNKDKKLAPPGLPNRYNRALINQDLLNDLRRHAGFTTS